MKFIKKIREDLNLNLYQMSKKMNMKTVQEYISFEETKKSVNVEKLIKLWELSGLSDKAFMELMQDEITDKHQSQRES